jgi:hypothetical protein
VSEQPAAQLGPDRFLLAIIAGALGLVVVGIVAALVLARTPAPPPPDPNSPVGVVHAYVTAIQDGDADRAYSFLSQSARAARPLDEYRRTFPREELPSNTERRVLIELISEAGDRAEVNVTISTFSVRGDPFSASNYNREVTVRLVREDGTWRIDQPVDPFVLAY